MLTPELVIDSVIDGRIEAHVEPDGTPALVRFLLGGKEHRPFDNLPTHTYSDLPPGVHQVGARVVSADGVVATTRILYASVEGPEVVETEPLQVVRVEFKDIPPEIQAGIERSFAIRNQLAAMDPPMRIQLAAEWIDPERDPRGHNLSWSQRLWAYLWVLCARAGSFWRW